MNKIIFLVQESPRSRWSGVSFFALANSKDELKQFFPSGYEFLEDYSKEELHLDGIQTIDVDKPPNSMFTGLIALSHGKKCFWSRFNVGDKVIDVSIFAYKKEDIQFTNLVSTIPIYQPGCTTTPPPGMENVDIDKPKPWMIPV